jgi:hypothetical protein
VQRAAARVIELLAEGYEPPDYAEVPTPDAALFLAAIDHGTGLEVSRMVDGEGPYGGSALLWALGLAFERRRPGLLSAPTLRDLGERELSTIFTAGGETVSRPAERARLWRDAAAVLELDYGGSAAGLIDAAEGMLGGAGGLIERLGAIEAFSDPLAKKSFLVCKIWERRGWLAVADPAAWEVCADNVLMRLALRAGLIEPAEDVTAVRAATRDAFREVADAAGIPPQLLDDLLWELGREQPDLLGTAAGDLSEPPGAQGVHFY